MGSKVTGVKIKGIGKYVPEMVATNEDFTKIVETSDEWITQRTGIKQRHITNGEPTYYLGAMAAKAAMADAGVKAEDIDLIIATTVTGDYFTPSLSCLIQREIGAIGCIAFDLNAACAGFVYGFDTAKRYLQSGDGIKTVLWLLLKSFQNSLIIPTVLPACFSVTAQPLSSLKQQRILHIQASLAQTETVQSILLPVL